MGVTPMAQEAIREAKAVLGYKLYLDEAANLIPPTASKYSSGMTAEVARAQKALELATSGIRTCMISGGDPGVYAMAGAVFEVVANSKIALGSAPGQLEIKVITGTPSVTAAAALLGAPLTHDFCAVSLSDRLTPWDLIVKRLDLASQADFVIAIHNPKSHGRDWQLGEAVNILLKNLSPKTPVGIARRCGREGQSSEITTLDKLPACDVDMQTLIIVGNQSTFVYSGFMITPRGYIKKSSKS
jgi:precorrin-3B C17-methyltransferase